MRLLSYVRGTRTSGQSCLSRKNSIKQFATIASAIVQLHQQAVVDAVDDDAVDEDDEDDDEHTRPSLVQLGSLEDTLVEPTRQLRRSKLVKKIWLICAQCISQGINPSSPYPPSMIAMCFGIFAISRAAYRHLRKFFPVPSERLLRNLTTRITNTGLTDEGLTKLYQLQFAKIDTSKTGKVVVALMHDEIHLKASLSLSPTSVSAAHQARTRRICKRPLPSPGRHPLPRV